MCELAELLARQPRINAARGRKRVELLLEDGRLVEAFSHDRVPRSELKVEIDWGMIPSESAEQPPEQPPPDIEHHS